MKKEWDQLAIFSLLNQYKYIYLIKNCVLLILLLRKKYLLSE